MSRRRRLAGLATAGALVLGLTALGPLAAPVAAGEPTAPAPAAATDLGALTQDPAELADLQSQARAEGEVRVIATLETTFTAPGDTTVAAARAQRDAVDALSDDVERAARASGGEVVRDYGGDLPAVALSLTPQALAALAASPDVATLTADEPNRPLDSTTNPLVGAADAQDRGFHGGYGSGVVVLDTGVEASHPTFGGRVLNQACFSSTAECPNGQTAQLGGDAGRPCTFAPGCSHGTHVAGIAAGGGEHPGVADAATVTSIQVFSRSAEATCDGAPCPVAWDSDVLAALQAVYDHRALGFSVVNMSLGSGWFPGPCDTEKAPLKAAVDALRSVGIATVVAAGNNAWAGATASPGCLSSVITVGATDSTDTPAPFTNASPVLDVWAPGVDVASAVPGHAWSLASGTSMATPHVAGAIAMARAARPDLGVDEVEALLARTGPVVTDPRSGLARHRLDVLALLGADLPPLSDDAPADLRAPVPHPHLFRLTAPRPTWSVVAARPEGGAEVDLDVGTADGPITTSERPGDTVELVAVAGARRAGLEPQLARVRAAAPGGRYRVDLADDAQALTDSTTTVTMGPGDVVEVRDSVQAAGVATHYRVVPSDPGQDPELLLWQPGAATAAQARPDAVATASAHGPGQAEALVHTTASDQRTGLVLVNRAGSGTYTLHRDTTAPTGALVVDGGAASTSDLEVELGLTALDEQTGIGDVRVSVDGALDDEAWVPLSAARRATLPPGTGERTVVVQLRNGAGMTSEVRDTITARAAAPGAPTVTASTSSPGAVSTAFTPADGTGLVTSPVTGSQASCASTDGGTTRSATGTASPLRVTGLTAGRTYTCRVRSTSAAGTGAWSAPGPAVVVPTVPGAPTVSATTSPAASAVSVAVTAPARDGGSPVTGYRVACTSTNGGTTRTASSVSSPVTVTGLTRGRTYRCAASALNAVGTGPVSAAGPGVVVR